MKPVRVGIVGYGTVGSATARLIAHPAGEIRHRSGTHLEVTTVCRRSSISADQLPTGARAVSSWEDVIRAADVDIVVETMGGVDVSRSVVTSALSAGKPVVTANKNLLAAHGEELFALAEKKKLPLGFEATV